jgi:hypothetical protein
LATAKTESPQNRLTELFAWQGFSFEHPVDYAPTSLTGNRSEGYARLAGVGNINYQIRWKEAKNAGNLTPKLSSYLSRLERDAKKAKTPFRSGFDREGNDVVYRYTGVGQGRGRIFFSPSCNRVFFAEVVGGKKDQLLPCYRDMVGTFRSAAKGERETWSLFGLAFQVPEPMLVDKKVFQAGHTKLTLRCRKAKVEGGRWGFGKQLVEKHGLEPWARAALKLNVDPVDSNDLSLRFVAPGLVRSCHTLVRFDEEKNQIATLQVTTRNKQWRPDWDWLV